MDPYEKLMCKRRRNQKIRGWICTILFLAVSVCAVYYVLFDYCGFRVDITLNGDENVVIRYGDDFDDPMAVAVFRSDRFPEYTVTVPIRTEGNAEISKVGEYELVYSARYGFWENQVHRTVQVVDRVKPKIILLGGAGSYVRPGEPYREEGYIARDNYDGDLTEQVCVKQYHNRIEYTVTDSSGNRAEAVRELVYYDPVYPEIILEGDSEITLNLGFPYVEQGFSSQDNLDGDLTEQVTVSGKVDHHHAGVYTLRYSVTDSYGNRTSVSRVVNVVSPVQPEIVVPEGKVIYLTFDDGPSSYTKDLLAVLRKYDVKATFFVVKTKYIDLLDDIAADGHAIGIHSVTHDYGKIYASEKAYFDDLYEMQTIIAEHTGIWTSLVRFPGGSSNRVSSFNKGIMTHLSQELTKRGFQYFDWNVNSGDAGQTTKRECVVQYIIEGIQEYDVSIVLQHDIKKYSVEAVEEVIVWALENGYRFLPLESNSPNAHHQIRN